MAQTSITQASISKSSPSKESIAKTSITKEIASGVLNLDLTKGASRLDQLLDFASRENPKRGFLFVSKVLGKHIPVQPKEMRAIYDELAQACSLVGDTVFIMGMAETATGLGAGVADSLARANPSKHVYYQHTTRHHLDQPIWFNLNEAHSHATDHIIYQPKEENLAEIKQSNTIILIDDEMTTGKTLIQLALALSKAISTIEKVIIITLANWLDDTSAQLFNQLNIEVEFVDLIKGRVEFIADPNFSAVLPKRIDDTVCQDASRDDLGRLSLKMPYQLTDEDKRQLPLFIAQRNEEPTAKPHKNATSATNAHHITVIGTGEHLYIPFLLAEYLENKNLYDKVHFQSTTRSPILKGDAITSKITFEIGEQLNDTNKTHFIYNTPKQSQWLVLCETEDIALKNQLKQNQYNEI